MAGKQSRAESNFFLISLSQGYISTTGSPLNSSSWVAPQPAEVWAISLCIFNFSVRWNRCKRPLQEIPCEGRECCTQHSLLCHSMKRQFTGTHWGGLGKQSASSHSLKSKRHIEDIHHPIATAELCWQGEVPSSCWNCFIHGVVITVPPYVWYHSGTVISSLWLGHLIYGQSFSDPFLVTMVYSLPGTLPALVLPWFLYKGVLIARDMSNRTRCFTHLDLEPW